MDHYISTLQLIVAMRSLQLYLSLKFLRVLYCSANAVTLNLVARLYSLTGLFCLGILQVGSYLCVS